MIYDYTKDSSKMKSQAPKGYDFYIPAEQKVEVEEKKLQEDTQKLAEEKKEFETVKKVVKEKKEKPVLTANEQAIEDLLK